MAATCFVQPLDLVKNRMQIIKVAEGGQKPTTASILFGVVKNEGVTKLYNGLSAGLLRQATYTTTRLGRKKNQIYYFETYVDDCDDLEILGFNFGFFLFRRHLHHVV